MRKAIAIDFDGCLCENSWPEIGSPHMDVINAAIAEQGNGTALILWTCRVGELLEAAVDWCSCYGLEFDAVNANLPERLEHYGVESRKISADEYWDDLAVHMPSLPNDPLTLEELREMDGEPVWVTKAGYQSRWALVFVFSRRENIIRLTFDNGTQPIAKTLMDGCKIYRRKPEEG